MSVASALTLPAGTPMSKRGKPLPPHTGAVSRVLARFLGCSPKHAERQLATAKQVVDVLPLVAMEADHLHWLAYWSATFDAQRAVTAAPLPFTAALACQVARVDTDQNQRLTEYLADPTPEAKARLLVALRKDIHENQELLLALEAAA